MSDKLEVWEDELKRTGEVGKDSHFSRTYVVNGTDDEIIAMIAVIKFAPVAIDGYFLWRDRIAVNQIGPKTWEAPVGFGVIAPPDSKSGSDSNPNSGKWRLSWDTTGGTQHITQSRRTKVRGKNAQIFPGDAPDFKGGINVTESGVGGCDIHVPVFNWQETRSMDRMAVSSFAYLRNLYHLVGKVNDKVFRGEPIGDVLFLGARGDIDARDPRFCEVIYSFAASPSVRDVQIGNCDPVNKDGWDYLWVLYKDHFDVDAKQTMKVPGCVYVEEVYAPGDFDQLLIGR